MLFSLGETELHRPYLKIVCDIVTLPLPHRYWRLWLIQAQHIAQAEGDNRQALEQLQDARAQYALCLSVVLPQKYAKGNNFLTTSAPPCSYQRREANLANFSLATARRSACY